MNNDVKTAKEMVLNGYKLLSLDDKRNEYSKEIYLIVAIINHYSELLGLEPVKEAYNYQQKLDMVKTEDELINLNYEDILNIKEGLLSVLSKLLEGRK